MTKGKQTNVIKGLQWVLYPSLCILGVLIILLSSWIRPMPLPPKGEYFYAVFLRSHISVLSMSFFVAAAWFVGHKTNANPWLSGACLFFIFPAVSVYEATVYKGSHNLIPFEFVVFFMMALPAVAAVYVGRFTKRMWKKGAQ